jgi:hypothetical protein
MIIINFKPKMDVKAVLEQESKYKLYERAITRFVINHGADMNKESMKKLIFLYVKYIGAIQRTDSDDREISFYQKTPMERFQYLDTFVKMIGLLMPVELLQLFPVTKIYDGDKYQMKDYFYTMECISKLDPEQRIGREAFALLWDYTNWDISMFMVSMMSTMNMVGMYQGKLDMTDFIFNTLFDDKAEDPKMSRAHLKVVK